MTHGFCRGLVVALAVGGVGVAHAATEGDVDSSAGLPQLDLSTWPTQIFWLIISFSVAYLLMWRLVVPKIVSVLEERHNKMEDDLQRASKAANDAGEARLGLEATLAEARSKANEKTRVATEKIMKKVDKKLEATVAELAKKQASAEDAIDTAKAAAMREMAGIAATATVDVVYRLAGVKVTSAEAKESVSQSEKWRAAQ